MNHLGTTLSPSPTFVLLYLLLRVSEFALDVLGSCILLVLVLTVARLGHYHRRYHCKYTPDLGIITDDITANTHQTWALSQTISLQIHTRLRHYHRRYHCKYTPDLGIITDDITANTHQTWALSQTISLQIHTHTVSHVDHKIKHKNIVCVWGGGLMLPLNIDGIMQQA